MSTSDLSPAGSSTYSSNTLHVGDGTWDNGRDDFLLPNLVGLNFATMQYNGMGNRFRALPEYHSLILGHGVLAAITFLLIVPAAVFIAKFYRRNPRLAVKMHVYLQILNVFLLTVVVVLGYFAVGPERSLTNPHHGIGWAIYVLVLAQFIFGWLMSRIEKRRKNPMALTRVPTKVWMHKVFGRSIALLGIVQIPLGLTLYGSPKVLFILYALTTALLLFAYLVMDRYYFEKRPVEFGLDGGPEFYSDYSSYLSGSRTDLTQDQRRRPQEGGREESHWGRDLLAGAGVLGAYEAFKRRRSTKREGREQDYPEGEEQRRTRMREEREQWEMDEERRRKPPPRMAPGAASSRRSSRPPRPPPGVEYGTGSVPTGTDSRLQMPGQPGQGRIPPPSESRLSPESWEDEKLSERPQKSHTWRDRLLGAGAGVGAFAGVKSIFNRRKRRDEEYDDASSYRPPLGGSQNMVSQTDVSRVEEGQAPMSPPNDPRRQERLGGVQPMTPTQTPSRMPRRPRPSADSMSYDDDESFADPPPGTQHMRHNDNELHTLRNSIATFGAIGGFREWQKHRRERNDRQRAERLRRQELDNEEQYNRRNSMNYPRPHDAGGRRPSLSGTVMTGTTAPQGPDTGFVGSNPELSRSSFRPPDTRHPPLPAAAGTLTGTSGTGAPPNTAGPSENQQRVNEATGGYQLPPPPPGPPPGMSRPADYQPPEPGSLQMPPGAVEPDPTRLMSQENITQQSSSHAGRDTAAGLFAGAAAANMANSRRLNSQSESPSRYHSRQDSRTRLKKPERRGSTASGSVSQSNTASGPSAAGAGPSSPPVSVKVKMHNDGRHVTLRRLNEEEAAAERAARRAERKSRHRRGSTLSSGVEDDAAPPGSNQRYRRNGGGMRPSSSQPITNIPAPPAMSSTAGSTIRPPSELNLPAPPRVPTHSLSPQDGLSPPVAGAPMAESLGSPGEGTGEGTDVSAFDNNRRRRRAERARKLEAARGQKVEFQ